MKKSTVLIACLLASLVGLVGGFFYERNAYKYSPEYARERVLLLRGDTSYCTGFLIVAPSGSVYTLTAYHCKTHVLTKNNVSLFLTEYGEEGTLRFIAENANTDLLLLSAPVGYDGFLLATNLNLHDVVHATNHGSYMPTYTTQGEVLSLTIHNNTPYCLSKDDATAPFMCPVPPVETLSTNVIYPGASGGPLLNVNNEVVGLMRARHPETAFAYSVSIQSIQEFLKGH